MERLNASNKAVHNLERYHDKYIYTTCSTNDISHPCSRQVQIHLRDNDHCTSHTRLCVWLSLERFAAKGHLRARREINITIVRNNLAYLQSKECFRVVHKRRPSRGKKGGESHKKWTKLRKAFDIVNLSAEQKWTGGGGGGQESGNLFKDVFYG